MMTTLIQDNKAVNAQVNAQLATGESFKVQIIDLDGVDEKAHVRQVGDQVEISYRCGHSFRTWRDRYGVNRLSKIQEYITMEVPLDYFLEAMNPRIICKENPSSRCTGN